MLCLYCARESFLAMDELILKTIDGLESSRNVASLKISLIAFLEGFKEIAIEYDGLKTELRVKNQQLSTVESQLKKLQDEKVDMITSIEANTTAIDVLNSLNSTANARPTSSSEDTSKDARISHLEKTIVYLENKLDATEAYEGRDSIIISGAVPAATLGREENSSEVAIDLIKKKPEKNL